MIVGAEWGTGQVFLSMMYFFLFVMWISLVFLVFSDIMRSRDLSGGAKAGWSIFIIVLPYLGVFVYLIARGGDMGERALDAAERCSTGYSPAASGSPSSVDQLATLASMRERGLLDDDEFARMKAKVLASA